MGKSSRPGRRKVRFRTLDEIVADARRLGSAPYQRLGQWSLGQVCRHVATGMRLSIDGEPAFPEPSLAIRVLGRALKHWVLWRGLWPGVRLPDSAARFLVPAETDDAGGVRELEDSVARLRGESHRMPAHPVFGRFTREQWNRYHRRHAELHFSFLVPLRPPNDPEPSGASDRGAA